MAANPEIQRLVDLELAVQTLVNQVREIVSETEKVNAKVENISGVLEVGRGELTEFKASTEALIAGIVTKAESEAAAAKQAGSQLENATTLLLARVESGSTEISRIDKELKDTIAKMGAMESILTPKMQEYEARIKAEESRGKGQGGGAAQQRMVPILESKAIINLGKRQVGIQGVEEQHGQCV